MIGIATKEEFRIERPAVNMTMGILLVLIGWYRLCSSFFFLFLALCSNYRDSKVSELGSYRFYERERIIHQDFCAHGSTVTANSMFPVVGKKVAQVPWSRLGLLHRGFFEF